MTFAFSDQGGSSALGDRLLRFLIERDERYTQASVVEIGPMGGGYSREMHYATLQLDGVLERLVLRSDPVAREAMAETDREVEWELLQALKMCSGISVPVPRWFDQAGEITGAPALLVDYIEGSPWSQLEANRSDPVVLARKLGELSSKVHAIPVGALPAKLGSATSWSDYIDRRIAQLRHAAGAFLEADPVVRYVAAWLETHRPGELPLTLVHGDFQIPNVLVESDGEYALLDWELAHIGDPREDLGRLIIVGALAGVDPLAGHYDTLLDTYRAATGLGEDAINRQTVAYFSIISAMDGMILYLQRLSEFTRGHSVPTDFAYMVLPLTGIRATLLNATTVTTVEATQ